MWVDVLSLRILQHPTYVGQSFQTPVHAPNNSLWVDVTVITISLVVTLHWKSNIYATVTVGVETATFGLDI